MSIAPSPLVTIGIPTYNRADGFLRDALESAIGQTYPNLEIIVSDNCSNDDTEAVVKRYNDQRIRYFKHNQNIGANNNFNFCLKEAKGVFFLLLHDDDLIDPDFIEACISKVKDDFNIGIIRTGTRLVDSKGLCKGEVSNKASGLTTKEFFLAWFEGKTALYLCSTLFNTELLKNIGGFQSKTNLFQDVVAEVTLAAKYGRVDLCDVKASFRHHQGEITFGVKVEDWCEDSLFLLSLMEKLVPEDNELIAKKGKKFFCRTNYNRTINVSPIFERILTFYRVFKKFGYCYSPTRYLGERALKSLKGSIKLQIKKYSQFDS